MFSSSLPADSFKVEFLTWKDLILPPSCSTATELNRAAMIFFSFLSEVLWSAWLLKRRPTFWSPDYPRRFLLKSTFPKQTVFSTSPFPSRLKKRFPLSGKNLSSSRESHDVRTQWCPRGHQSVGFTDLGSIPAISNCFSVSSWVKWEK